ncbi:MAG: amino acid decarboxylase [Clostridia bacterium]|nr:amino acid decarboxylase [Clostridia bacterium]
MRTPVADFIRRYEERDMARFHVPGHKGKERLGFERFDITEVKGADELYDAEGIIGESEQNATALFGTKRSCYSTEGSSQCIRALLYLLLTHRPEGTAPVIVAARNVHKAFVYAAALLDFEVEWLWPEESDSLCRCVVTPERLEEVLSARETPPAAVYVTSPDYLGTLADVAGLAAVCHRHGTRLAVDNAHGAYLRFLTPSLHPMDLGADLCCDSAHKTLPVLTGGAYLHFNHTLPQEMVEDAKHALALFGSTSPSYLILASLDLCNRHLAEEAKEQLAALRAAVDDCKAQLSARGWQCEPSDPLRITLRAPEGIRGAALADRLRERDIECEYADESFVVLMVSASTRLSDLERLAEALGESDRPPAALPALPLPKGERACSVRTALFSARERVAAADAVGRICGAPTVSCPPAIPIAVSGERIGEAAAELFAHYGMATVDVVCE